jgi:hypothetical protein
MTEILKNRRDSGKSFTDKRIAGLAFVFFNSFKNQPSGLIFWRLNAI